MNGAAVTWLYQVISLHLRLFLKKLIYWQIFFNDLEMGGECARFWVVCYWNYWSYWNYFSESLLYQTLQNDPSRVMVPGFVFMWRLFDDPNNTSLFNFVSLKKLSIIFSKQKLYMRLTGLGETSKVFSFTENNCICSFPCSEEWVVAVFKVMLKQIHQSELNSIMY